MKTNKMVRLIAIAGALCVAAFSGCSTTNVQETGYRGQPDIRLVSQAPANFLPMKVGESRNDGITAWSRNPEGYFILDLKSNVARPVVLLSNTAPAISLSPLLALKLWNEQLAVSKGYVDKRDGSGSGTVFFAGGTGPSLRFVLARQDFVWKQEVWGPGGKYQRVGDRYERVP